MSEVAFIHSQVDGFVLGLGYRVARLCDALEHLRAETLLRWSQPVSEEEIERWTEHEGFALVDGVRRSGRRLAARESGKLPPHEVTHFWGSDSYASPGARRRLYGLRDVGPRLLELQQSLEGVAWIYYQDVENAAVVFPWFDIPQVLPKDFDWRTYHTFQSVEPEANPSGGIRWTPPNIDYGGEGLITSVSIPIHVEGIFTGLWSIDVPLRTIHQNCVHERVVPEQHNFILDVDGEFIAHESIAAEIDKSVGSVLRKHVSSLGGDFATLDLPALFASGRGELELRDADGRRLLVVYRVVPSLGWLFIATFPKERMLEAINGKVLDAFDRLRRGDLSFRIDPSVSDEMHRLVDGFNAMSETLQANESSLRASEERFRRAFDGAPIGMALLSEGGRISQVNPALSKVFSAPLKGLVGTPFEALVDADDRAAWQEAFETLWSGRAGDRQLVLRCRDAEGELVWTDARAAVLRGEDDLPQKLILQLEDVTHRRLHQEAVEAARASAEAANAAKDRFLAMLSHELRTPLTPLVLTVTALLRDRSLPAETRRQLEIVRRNADLEARLIDDLLEVTAFSHGKMPLHRSTVDLHALVTRVAESCAPQFASAELTLERSFGASLHHVSVDPARIEQILWNLLRNALHYTPAGGRVELRTSNVHGAVRLEVRDDGVGIPPEALQRIFEPFEQVRTGAPRGGLGLGLSISRAIADAHGARLEVRSEGRGSGTCFALELACVTPESAAFAPSPGTQAEQPALKLLLVEDDLDTAETMCSLLEMLGHDVKHAASVKGALTLADECRFDLAVCDLGLPDGSGHQLIRELRSRHHLEGIALSGYGLEDDLRRSSEAGFLRHLTKPVSLDHLESTLREVGSTLASA